VTTDLNTLPTALYVKIDGEIGRIRCLGRPPLLSDSELLCLAVTQALLGYHSEARWLRYANKHPTDLFPYLSQRPGRHWRLKAACGPSSDAATKPCNRVCAKSHTAASDVIDGCPTGTSLTFTTSRQEGQ
jgi:hypothetical protein